MQTACKRFSVLTGFGLLLILLIANAFITRRELGVQIEDQGWVAHSRQVLYELAQTESLLKDAETGQRGFLYTGDPKYLTPYTQAVAQVQPHIDEVARLTPAWASGSPRASSTATAATSWCNRRTEVATPAVRHSRCCCP
jgi:CHASE3 domain sensor protein